MITAMQWIRKTATIRKPRQFLRWLAWRNLCDRIISNKHYRYSDPKKGPYIKLAAFAAEMMGHHNTLMYGPDQSYTFPRRFALAHLRRCPTLPKCIYEGI